jgi:hypothetical protein
VGQVRAGAEGRPVARDDEGPDGRIGLQGLEGVDELGDHRQGQGVAALGVGQDHGRHPVRDLGADERHASESGIAGTGP